MANKKKKKMKTKNKKGLVSGIMVVSIILFIFAFTSIIAFVAWEETNTAIENLPNETVNQPTKNKIAQLSRFFTWADTLFVYLFVFLMISYLISSITIPTRFPFWFIIVFVMLMIVTIVAMIFSNAWAYIIENPNFVAAAVEFKFTTFFMRYYPIFVFFIGLVGAVIFYGRTKSEPAVDAGVDFPT